MSKQNNPYKFIFIMHIRICYWSTDIRDKKILSDTCVWQINISLDIVSFFSDECSTGNYPYIFFFYNWPVTPVNFPPIILPGQQTSNINSLKVIWTFAFYIGWIGYFRGCIVSTPLWHLQKSLPFITIRKKFSRTSKMRTSVSNSCE